jgi:hypothetical protein
VDSGALVGFAVVVLAVLAALYVAEFIKANLPA